MASSSSPAHTFVPVVPSPVSDSATVHVKDQSRPFWTGYQFKCDKQEQEYFERHKLMLVRAFQAWGIIRLIYDTLLPLSYHSRGLALSISVAYIPNVVITLIMLLMVSCTLRFRKYIVLIISMAFAVFVISTGVMVHVQTNVLVDNALKSDLPRVVKRLATDPEALQELEDYLKITVSETAVREASWNVLPQMLLLVHTGLWRSTMMSLFAIPITFGIAMPAIPELLQPHFRMPLVIDVMVWGYLFGNLLMTTLNRRRSFLLEYCFQTALETAVAASRQADSILNHTLKNTMGDAAGNIEMFLDEVDSSTDVVYLRQSWASLRGGMRACQHRQAYLHLAAQKYKISLHPVALLEFATEVTSGRQVRLNVPNVTVLLDPTLCGLIFDNVLNNAFKHGHSVNPDVELTIECAADEYELALLKFIVSNAVNADRPCVTQEYVTKVLSGEALQQSATSAMSNRVGLQHCFEAAKAHDMTASLQQREQRVFFESQVMAQVVPSQSVATDAQREADLAAYPSGLHIYCIDDSEAARRLLDYNMRLWADTENVRVFGKDVTEVATFKDCVLEDGDIAFLDQHLEYGGDDNVLGTDIVEELLERGYKGLICIRSGNVAEEDLAKYDAAGAHCAFGKDVAMRKVIEDMKVAYTRYTINTQSRPTTPLHQHNLSHEDFLPGSVNHLSQYI